MNVRSAAQTVSIAPSSVMQTHVSGLNAPTPIVSGRERANRYTTNEPVAVLCLDLDKLKEVNDLKGHQRGDHVLREVSQRLTNSFILSDVDAACAAVSIGDQLRRSVCAPIRIGAEAVRVDDVCGALTASGLNPRRLHIEVTENLFASIGSHAR